MVSVLPEADNKLSNTADIGATLSRGIREVFFLAYIAVALFILIALFTFNVDDAGWTHTGSGRPPANGAGAVGAWLADLGFSLFGVTAFLFPLLLAGYGYSVYKGERKHATPPLATRILHWLGFAAAMGAAAAIADLHWQRSLFPMPQGTGGILGQEVAHLVFRSFGAKGTTVLLTGLFLTGVSLYTGLSWVGLIDIVGKYSLIVVNGFLAVFNPPRRRADLGDPEPATEPLYRESAAKPKPAKTGRTEPLLKPAPKPAPAQTLGAAPAVKAPAPLAAGKSAKAPDFGNVPAGALPSPDLLTKSAPKIRGYTREVLEEMSRLVESILDDFGVDVQVTEVHPGPVITRFELQPAAGVKVSRISGLAKDLARALSVTSVRVVEIIPGKSVIGLEIPNQEREMVLLYSLLCSDAYRHSDSPLTMVLGKDISGHPVVANLARMPHLLVAGTTGSGKSVAVNVMILSMLYKATPAEVRMIMIDPKMLELSIYEGIPHLLTPVVTDMKEAANALRWSVAEMERRYKLMSMVGVRNLAGFNQKVREAIDEGDPILDPLWKPDLISELDVQPALEPLPQIVIIIDELADMMMIVGKKVEELIARLAQKARAAGIHLILATQRPSVDVLTGLIKANIPTRLSFQVSSRIDSRTILDQGGAESLLGNGDMLYLPPGTGIPMRAHGAFVSDQEVHNVVEFLKLTGPARYIDEITRFNEDAADFSGYKGGDGEGGDESDDLYDEAVRFVTERRKASISSVQRRFKVGYNRAARMIEDMERAGVVGPAEPNGSRTVIAPPPPPVD
ncbi:MAG: cell division protein FtsK [Methylococcaceae bacterium]|nr:cell division protein FtsK [Methylococcaceae bacterium]